jgi:hypothetical protein
VNPYHNARTRVSQDVQLAGSVPALDRGVACFPIYQRPIYQKVIHQKATCREPSRRGSAGAVPLAVPFASEAS